MAQAFSGIVFYKWPPLNADITIGGKPMNGRAETHIKQRSRLKSWGVLLAALGLVGGFAFVVGPWLQKQIPIVDEMFTLIEEHEINSNAYFYTDIEASYDGEKFLRNSIRLADEKEARLNIPFISGLVCCILILWLGYRFMPMD